LPSCRSSAAPAPPRGAASATKAGFKALFP
jgi:hypothetical protein